MVPHVSNKDLAHFCYAVSGIPRALWEAHWEIDRTRSHLRKSAVTAYRAIFSSYQREG